MTLFEGRDLTCQRGERQVFTGLDFAVPARGALVLQGPNGSGKSSLLRLMAGLARPAGGALYWGGQPISDEPEGHLARLHYLGHLDAVKLVLSSAENLTFWAQTAGRDPAGVTAALDRIGLAALADLPARLLSAGQRRRLALARLLVAGADIWLLDEPTVGLDERSIGQLETGLAEHREGGGRVVVATHTAIDLPEADRIDLADFASADGEALASW